MTNEERDLISQFVQRVGGRPAGSGGFAGSVPTAGTPPLPPVDPQADALLADLFQRFPEARYRITQFAFVQEHAVMAATNTINQLQAQVQQLSQQLQQMQQAQSQPQQASPWGQPVAQPQPQPSRGLFGGLFGGGTPAPAPAPQYQQPAYTPPPQMAPQMAPQYAPGYQPGMFQRSGSGFLGSALTTAAGVAGGMVAAHALEGLFSGSHESAAAASFGEAGGGFGGPQNLPGEAAPWGSPAPIGYDPADQGGDAKSYGAPDQSTWSPAPAADTGWQDAGATDSGWSDAGSSTDFDNT